MKTLLALFVLIALYTAPQTTRIDDLHFFAGTWKMENKENYETWSVNDDRTLSGNAYKIRDGNKQVTEYFMIKESGDQIIYTATVPNQNNGQPVDFILNKEVKDKFSFEDPTHDFPKKVQYTKLNDSTLFIAVLGDNDKGFSYKLIKQKQAK